MKNRNNRFHFALLSVVLAAAGCGGGGGSASPALGPPVLTMASSSADFGDVAVGNTRTLEVTLSNSGESPLALQMNSVPGSSFTASGIGAGVTVPPGQYVTLSVSFSPSGTGKASGMVSLSSNSSSAPASLSLTGDGVVTAHSVALNWKANASTVVGYNIYRFSPLQPLWTRLNSSPVMTTSYTDWDVQSGESYFFTVTSVTASNFESPSSEIASVTVPTP